MYTIERSYRGPKFKFKKSVFLASIYSVTSRKEVKQIRESISKEFRKASHNAWAFRIRIDGNVVEDYGDDGEVKGTAGRVLATHLEHSDLVDVILFVTRFYGGINLGKGGLLRSYSKVAKELVDNIPKHQLD